MLPPSPQLTYQQLAATANTTAPPSGTPPSSINDVAIQLHEQCNHLPKGYALSVFDPDTGLNLEYRQLIKHPKWAKQWQTSGANEFGRLAQGIRNIKGTNTINFVARNTIPKGYIPTYARFVCSLRPQKSEVERTRLTVGGNLIQYTGRTSSPTADLTTFKLQVNSTLSTPGAKNVCADISNFYLGTPLEQPEWMRVHIDLIPEEIITTYNLHDLVDNNGWIYLRINKGMYGLPQAGRLANDLLQKRLAPHGYFPVQHTPGFWRHTTKPVSFVLVVDDFSIKYTHRSDADEFFDILRQHYQIKIDWSATLFSGITIKWDYVKRTADLSMPGYITKMLAEFNHPTPKRPQHSPHPHNPITYGAKTQFAPLPESAPPLNPPAVQRIQRIVGTLLYYARAVDGTLNVALSTLASEQAHATDATTRKVHQLLDYCHTYPNAVLRYHASDMQLKLYADAGYANETKARSRAGGHLFLGNKPPTPEIHNGAVLNPTSIIRHVASSAAEAEIGSAFISCKEAIPLRNCLHEMGWPQDATPVTLDNTTATGFATNTTKVNRTRAIDMRYWWLKDREAQQQFKFIWEAGSKNLADYFTKHHPPSHHQAVRSNYVLFCFHQLKTMTHLSDRTRPLRGCVNPTDTTSVRTTDRLPCPLLKAGPLAPPAPAGTNQRSLINNETHKALII